MSRWALFGIKTFRNQKRKPRSLRREGWQRLALLFAVSIMLTLWLRHGSVTAEILFQSPQSPPAEESQPAPQPTEPPPVEEPPTEPPPTEPPPAEEPVPEEQPVEEPPAEPPPAEEPVPEEPTAEQPPAEQPPAEETTAEEQPATDFVSPLVESNEDGSAPAEESGPEPIRPERVDDEEFLLEEETQGGARNFILDRIELIDSVVVSMAYIWLCCGVLLFLLAPVLMLILYIRGRSRLLKEEGP